VTDIGILRPTSIRKLAGRKVMSMVKKRISDFGLEFPEGLTSLA